VKPRMSVVRVKESTLTPALRQVEAYCFTSPRRVLEYPSPTEYRSAGIQAEEDGKRPK
jgi:hypothetical protein